MAATEAPAGRSDARRNRQLLVSTARDLFASSGVDVPAREVARRAGVGVGTLYRHFPTREHLVDAVVEEAFEELTSIAEAALGDPDPWRGFTRFVEDTIALHARNRGLKDVVETQIRGRQLASEMRRRIRALARRVVARAHEAGVLRQDFAPQDILLVFWASHRVMELAAPVAPEIWRRQLAFVLDGLRPSAATPLPQPPLTEAELRRVGRIKQAGAR